MDTHQLLEDSSFHPPHISKGVLKLQLIRYARISSYFGNYSHTCDILYATLKFRGYSACYFTALKAQVWQSWHHNVVGRGTQLVGDQNILPLVVLYSPFSARVARSWKKILRQNKRLEGARLVTAYKNHKNLRKYLVTSHIDLAWSRN